MKTILTILMLCGVYYGYAQNTPPYAASTKTWKFFNQTWSDAIQMPDCNKESFEDSDTYPQCRSDTDGSQTWYYYNWPYVNANGTKMCPVPWRVPTYEDIVTLPVIADHVKLMDKWGAGGTVGAGYSASQLLILFMHSATRFDRTSYYCLTCLDEGCMILTPKNLFASQVRCVKGIDIADLDKQPLITEQKDDDIADLDEQPLITEQKDDDIADLDEHLLITAQKDEVFLKGSPDQNPEFPGGEEAMMKWINNELKYPVIAMEMGIGGHVTVSFVVGKDGSIRDVAIVHGVDASLDKEAIRVVSKMPKWIPGRHEGKPVSVKWQVTLGFQIRQR